MKYCTKCKKHYPQTYNYCNKCGTKLTTDPLPMGELFTEDDKDFSKFRRGFSF